MKNATELTDLTMIEQGASIYLSPAGNASEKLYQQLQTQRPDIKVLGYIDTYKSGNRADLEIFKLSEINTPITLQVIVLMERESLRNKIIDNLYKKDIKNLLYVGRARSFLEENTNISTLESNTTLYFYYDLSVNALNFEYLNSLYQAEVLRIRRGLDFLHPVIVPQLKDSIFDLSRTAVAGTLESDNSWFMDNVIIPSTSLIPSISGISTFKSRKEVKNFYTKISDDTFPENYSVDNPVELKSSEFLYDQSEGKKGHELPFRASNTAKLFVKQWLDSRSIKANAKIVVITLREVAYQTERNSDLAVWKSFAGQIKKRGFLPIFIRDTYSAFTNKDFSDFIVFNECSWNIFLRIALYELAYLNMMACTGPHTLCTYNKRTRYIIFNTLQDDGYVGSKEFLENGGIPIGYQYFAREPFQTAVWGKDKSCDLILDEFNAMVEKIGQSDSESLFNNQ